MTKATKKPGGWGFHDFVGDVVGQLEEEFGGR
jgi:hypothetical protein